MQSRQSQNLVVTIERPHHILATENGYSDILNHNVEELRLETIQVFTGPQTDVNALQTCIFKARAGESSKTHLILYDRIEGPQLKLVSFAPYYDAPGIELTCLITIVRSNAILLKDVREISQRPSALVTSDYPYHIKMVGQGFTALFGFESAQICGQSINSLICPETDILRWCTMFQNACEGQVDNAELILTTLAQNLNKVRVVCTPVVEHGSGPIKYVLFAFEQLEAVAPSSASQEAAAEQSAVSSAGEQSGVVSRPESPEPCVERSKGGRGAPYAKIYPRRKAHEERSELPSLPVKVTLELIEELSQYTLYRAADKIGVSATALKMACRKLGIAKWQCKRRSPPPQDNAAPRAAEAAAAPPQQPAPASHHQAHVAQPSFFDSLPATAAAGNPLLAPAAMAAWPATVCKPAPAGAWNCAPGMRGARAWDMGAVEAPDLDVPLALNEAPRNKPVAW